MEKLLDKTVGKYSNRKDSDIEKAEILKLVQSMTSNHPIELNKFTKMALCKNMYKGQQYYALDESDLSLASIEDTGETRAKYNIIKPLIDMWAAKMLDGDPTPTAKPHEGNTESIDVDVAKICTSILQSWWATARVRKKLGGAVKWGGKVGMGIFKHYYNKNGGKKQTVNKEEAEKLGITLKELEEMSDLYSGSCELELIDPIDFFPDPAMQPEWKDHRMVVHRFKKPVTEAEDEFDKPRGTFKADDKSEREKDRIESDESADQVNISDLCRESETLYVKELWMKADKKYKNGKHVIVINDQIIINESNPNPDMLPFFLFAINREEDEFTGAGYVWPLHPIQRDFKLAWSKILDNIEWTANNKVLHHVGANLAYNAFNQLAGEKIKWSGTVPPEYLRGEGLPTQLVSVPNMIFALGQILIALPDVDLGNIPERGAQMSRIAIQELKESSAMAHAENKNAIIECIRDLCLNYLQTVQEKYSAEKIAEIVGKNRMEDIDKFLMADINPESLDITIVLAQGFGTSPSVKVQQINDAVDRGILSPIEARRGLSNFGNIDMIIDESELDKNKAERNLRKIVSGLAYANSGLMSPFDDYDIHAQVFKNFTKKIEHEELDKNTQMEISAYISQALDLKLQYQQNMAMMQQPPPQGGMGGASQPQGNTAMQQMQAENNLHMSPGHPPINQGFGQEPMGT